MLAARLARDGHSTVAAALLAAGGAGWLLLSYSLPLLLAGRSSLAPALSGANGTWFIWTVGTQSIAVAATSLQRPVPVALATLAVACWAVGVVLYLVIAVMMVIARLQYPVRPASLTVARVPEGVRQSPRLEDERPGCCPEHLVAHPDGELALHHV